MGYGLSIVTINQQSIDTPDHRYIIQPCQAIVQGKTKENIMQDISPEVAQWKAKQARNEKIGDIMFNAVACGMFGCVVYIMIRWAQVL
jgi:hypothetical protein